MRFHHGRIPGCIPAYYPRWHQSRLGWSSCLGTGDIRISIQSMWRWCPVLSQHRSACFFLWRSGAFHLILSPILNGLSIFSRTESPCLGRSEALVLFHPSVYVCLHQTLSPTVALDHLLITVKWNASFHCASFSVISANYCCTLTPLHEF